MLIGTSSTIAEIQSRQFSHDSTSYHVNALEYEAGKIEMSSAKQRESFGEMVDTLPGYTSSIRAWDRASDGSLDCFNVTLENPATRLRLNCVG